ncbi:MAG: ATP-binding protein [Candidatus Tectomicrobia bacterium]|nr:ATP-binding protein [Candidatus Tectomicrobia bacterium]
MKALSESTRSTATPRPEETRSACPIWLFVYYLLAAFTLLTVIMTLWLSHHLMDVYRGSIEVNQEWAKRLSDYAELGQLAAMVNAPANAVFESHDVATESARMRLSLRLFHTYVTALEEDLRTHVDAVQAASLLEDLNMVRHAIDEMAGEADLVYAALQQQQAVTASQHLARMNRDYADAHTALATLREDVHLVQSALFNTQTTAAAALKKYEYMIAGVMVVLVCGAVVYGHTLAKRMEQAEELRRAKEAAEEANRAKSAFLANMSHELLTPLNHIIGFTRIVMRQSKDVLPAKQYDNLGKVLGSAERLSELINDILDLSKIEANQVEVRPVSFDLEPLVDRCLNTVKNEHLKLVKVIEANLPMLWTDQDKLKHILTNMLSNAVKFTDEGTVTVTARRQDGELVLAVADTGIGISEDVLEHIFDTFRQVDNSTTRRFGGSGLGLSISRHLARLLGGEMTVQSRVGTGSTFTVTLPLRYTATQTALSSTEPATGPEFGIERVST